VIPRLPAPYPPLFFPIASWLDRLPGHPDAGAVARLAEGAGLRTENGQVLRFVPPQADGLGYERRIWDQGEVETRPDNWHDFFNALVWLAFPMAKGALNARHIREMAVAEEGRGVARDAMTHFDECGLVVVSADAALLESLRGFQWKELYWERRAEVLEAMRFFVFGHATYEQLLAPFRGLTAKAVLYEVGEDWLARPLGEQLADLDGRLAADLAAGLYASPRELQPVPLLGIPGVTPDNESAAYYDDTWQFRPGRRANRV
jgi:hypothetical protein